MMKKTILACVFLQLVLGTVFAQTVDSTHIKNMHAYYKKHFSDPTDPIVLTASDTLLDMAIRCNDTVMSKIALGAKLDYYYYGQGENRTDSVIAGVNRLKRFARSVGNAELYYWAWAARLVNYYIIQGEYNIALLEAEKMLQEAKKEGKQESIAECYYALANVYAAKGLMKKSQEFMLKEIDIFENTAHPYTEGLFGSLPDIENREEELHPIPGLMPDPTNLPSGCPFHPRCKYAMKVCASMPVPEQYISDTHRVSCFMCHPQAPRNEEYESQKGGIRHAK